MLESSTLTTCFQMDPGTQLSRTIPAAFHTQQSGSQASSQASDQHVASHAVSSDSTGVRGVGASHTQPSPLLSLADLQLVALDIKSTLSAAITDLKSDMRAMASHLEHIESAALTHSAAIQQVQRVISVHAQHLIDMNRHLEDLDNRDWRRNLCIRGIPESVEGPQLQSVVWAIFNTLLSRPLDSPVEI